MTAATRPYPLPRGVADAEGVRSELAGCQRGDSPTVLVAVVHPVHGWLGVVVEGADGPTLAEWLAAVQGFTPCRSILSAAARLDSVTVRDVAVRPGDRPASVLAARWLVIDHGGRLTVDAVRHGPNGVRTVTRIREVDYAATAATSGIHKTSVSRPGTRQQGAK